ncbi:MAG: hypothetical protein WDN03_18095 [Rhizomicrobium sp.]
MPVVDLADVEHLLHGHIDVRRRPGSLQPLRYPAAEHAYYDVFTRWVASAPAGVRLRLRTDSGVLRLTVKQRVAAFDGTPRPAAWPVFVNGKPHGAATVVGGAAIGADGVLKGDENAAVTVDLPAGDNAVEVWLPQTATVSLTELAIADGRRWAPWPDTRKRVLFHGSSITHCMEADTPAGAWPAVAAGLADIDLVNLGWAGSCLISGLAARIIRDRPLDGIVLKLGIIVHGEGQLKERTFVDSVHACSRSMPREAGAHADRRSSRRAGSPPREDEAAPAALYAQAHARIADRGRDRAAGQRRRPHPLPVGPGAVRPRRPRRPARRAPPQSRRLPPHGRAVQHPHARQGRVPAGLIIA